VSLLPLSFGIKTNKVEWVGLTLTSFLVLQIVHSALPFLLLLHSPFNLC
jgi:hypothetical protein